MHRGTPEQFLEHERSSTKAEGLSGLETSWRETWVVLFYCSLWLSHFGFHFG